MSTASLPTSPAPPRSRKITTWWRQGVKYFLELVGAPVEEIDKAIKRIIEIHERIIRHLDELNQALRKSAKKTT